MYFISRDYGNDVYEITDSTDNIAEKYTITEIESIVSRGFSIKGYSTKKCRVFPTLDNYIEFKLTKDRLNGGYKYPEKR